MIGEWCEARDRVRSDVDQQLDFVVEKQWREGLPSVVAVADGVEGGCQMELT